MRYAGFWRRLIAITVDQFLLGLAAYFLGSVAAVVALYFPPISPTGSDMALNYATLVSYAALGFIYFVWLEGRTGQTFGKKILKIKLIRLDQPNRDGIDASRAALRLLVAFVFQLFAGVNYILMLLSKERRTLHDKIFKTAVVYDPAGKFAAFDPEKFPLAKARPYLFAIALLVSFLAAVGQVLYFSGLI